MAGVTLYDYQYEALSRMKNGCILNGGVGSGKSRTGLAYYYTRMGGKVGTDAYAKMRAPKDLYIITTARKRDTFEWEGELITFLLSPDPTANLYSNKVVIDSWNNIGKYENVTGAFFIFDEQRVVGYGKWSKTFIKIARKNEWILLSATPGDTWSDYIPVFIANGFYRNKSDFTNKHVIWSRWTQYPKIDKYIDIGTLQKHRDSILIDMDFHRQTESHHIDILCMYDKQKYREIIRTRWNPWKNEPIETPGELCQCLRHVCNLDNSRIVNLLEILDDHETAIIFYNYNYELEMLRETLTGCDIPFSEWNGQYHQKIPAGNRWVYLVQYTAGCEGWNCTKTNTIIFFSSNYSYKVMVQASGRIDRLNTPFHHLYYYHLKSRSPIDIAIDHAIIDKKLFNESAFCNWKKKVS